jgi:hypothetical protein
MYGEVQREVLGAIRAAGRDLAATGKSPVQALDLLAAEPQRWSALGAERARSLAAGLKR